MSQKKVRTNLTANIYVYIVKTGMLKNIFLFIAFVSIFSCNPEETSEITEQVYILKEILVDPGDGSGTFEEVSINSKLTLFSSNSYEIVDGSICQINPEIGIEDNGDLNFIDKKVYSNNCPDYNPQFNLENDILEIYPPCIEACVIRFVKE